MKNLFLTAVVFSVLFIIGCKENSITDPISTESITKSQTTVTNITNGLIPLEGLLVLPGGFQTYFTIEGQINYSQELVPLDPAPPAPQFYIALNLSVRAALTDEAQNKFSISSESSNFTPNQNNWCTNASSSADVSAVYDEHDRKPSSIFIRQW